MSCVCVCSVVVFRSVSVCQAVLCHEIRNPLFALVANAELLLEQTNTLTPDQVEFVQSIHHSSNLMVAIVNDVLDVASLQAGQMRFDHVYVDLHRICQTIIKDCQPQATAKQLSIDLTIEADVPKHIKSDPTRIHQIMLNLVSNAIKATYTHINMHAYQQRRR